MQSIPDQIAVMESRLKNEARTVGDFCQFCGIAHSTWTRWKAERTTPNMRTWQGVVSQLEPFLAEKAA